MFKHIFIPLDGSRLAEAALPAAVFLAETLGARVTLMHVIEHDAPQEIHGDRHLSDPEEARQYLDEVAARAFPPGTDVERHVHGNEVRNVAQKHSQACGRIGTRPDCHVYPWSRRTARLGIWRGSTCQIPGAQSAATMGTHDNQVGSQFFHMLGYAFVPHCRTSLPCTGYPGHGDAHAAISSRLVPGLFWSLRCRSP